MNKTLSIVFLASILALASACDKEPDKPPSPAPAKTSGELNLKTAAAYAEAEVAIERLRKRNAPEIDWAAIEEQIRIALPVVEMTDRKHGFDYGKKIAEALKLCAEGQRPDVNQQTIAKGLQHVTVLALNDELDAMAAAAADDAAARKAHAAKIAALCAGIRPTFVRRDQDYFPETKTLEKPVDAASDEIQKAADGGGEGLFGARRTLEEAIDQTYALSVLFEIQEIERLRAADRAKCDVKKKEAEIFYRIIQAKVRRRDPEADKALTRMIETDYDTMDSAAFRQALQKGLPNIDLQVKP